MATYSSDQKDWKSPVGQSWANQGQTSNLFGDDCTSSQLSTSCQWTRFSLFLHLH